MRLNKDLNPKTINSIVVAREKHWAIINALAGQRLAQLGEYLIFTKSKKPGKSKYFNPNTWPNPPLYGVTPEYCIIDEYAWLDES